MADRLSEQARLGRTRQIIYMCINERLDVGLRNWAGPLTQTRKMSR